MPPYESTERLEYGPVSVAVIINIQDLPSIDTFNLKFTASFFLTFCWIDPRLMYINLNPETDLNLFTEEDIGNIWVPKVTFSNVLGAHSSQTDEKSKLMVQRNGEPDTAGLDYNIESKGT